jgi:hypothetical protein
MKLMTPLTLIYSQLYFSVPVVVYMLSYCFGFVFCIPYFLALHYDKKNIISNTISILLTIKLFLYPTP